MSDTIVEQTVSEQAAPVAVAAGIAIELAVQPVAQTNELSEVQKKAVASLLAQTKDFVKLLVQNGQLGTLSMTKIICYLMKNAETLQVDGDTIKGSDKKKVVLEVGKLVIAENVSAEQKAAVIELYDGLAEPTLEAMIDMSHGVNVATIAEHLIDNKQVQVAVGTAARRCIGFCH